MSWDIFVQDLPRDARTVRDIPDHFQPSPLGARSALIQQIRGIAPTADFTDPAWGRLDTPTFSVEFSLGSEELVRVSRFMFAATMPLPPLCRICSRTWDTELLIRDQTLACSNPVVLPRPVCVGGANTVTESSISTLPNKRLKLAARVDCGMNHSSARRSLSAIR